MHLHIIINIPVSVSGALCLYLECACMSALYTVDGHRRRCGLKRQRGGTKEKRDRKSEIISMRTKYEETDNTIHLFAQVKFICVIL